MYLPYRIAIGITGLNGHGRFFSKQELSDLSLLGKGAGSSKGLGILALFCLHNTKWWWQQCHMSLWVRGLHVEWGWVPDRHRETGQRG